VVSIGMSRDVLPEEPLKIALGDKSRLYRKAQPCGVLMREGGNRLRWLASYLIIAALRLGGKLTVVQGYAEG
jgi:hypothetical protein